ncbi:sialate O-acetylesterase [Candidatus Latescibacterota bacterium]
MKKMKNHHSFEFYKHFSFWREGYNMNFIHKLLIIFMIGLTPAISTLCDVSLPGIFGDNMVLQRGKEVPVWGTADPGETVIVSINDIESETTASNDGKWMVKLTKMEAGGPYEMKVVGNNIKTFTNVMIGEVWVCSGQSNMQWSVRQVKNIEKHIATANYPNIRLLTVDNVTSQTPQEDFLGNMTSWELCNPETVLPFSAVAFFFGRDIHRVLEVPVGLVCSSWGGTVAEAWTSRETLNADPVLRPILETWKTLISAYPDAKKRFDVNLAEWQKAADSGKTDAERPLLPRGPDNPNCPSVLYNAMISPMIPYGIAGIIWYQGESNANRAWQYRTLFPAMIRDWRKAWKQGDFPFIYVQIANWETKTHPNFNQNTWPELREAQLMALSEPNTAMAVTIDIGEAYNIHPNNKIDVGRRLALGALKVAYGREFAYSGPIYRSMEIVDNTIRVQFFNIFYVLFAKDGKPLEGFTIAGKDRKFYRANAVIDGEEIVVSCFEVPNPVAVRYGWEDNPVCTLFNSEWLPATPFRTDNWPGITDGIVNP